MFDLRQLRTLAQNAERVGASAGETVKIQKSLALVTDEELETFEDAFPPPKPDAETVKAEKEAAEKKADKTKRASAEIKKEKEEQPHLHTPRNADGSHKPSAEALEQERRRENLPDPNPKARNK